ncbi:hypothetical protein [Oceanobacillus oncorhynchi]|uniref:hypothetical protein n=1 Tax=Oceanobacillus oncorhynchi TaxID=545501 RepID=UPI0018695D08|nr:hypothetical protein [Oceanobacillus oncorhynchi]
MSKNPNNNSTSEEEIQVACSLQLALIGGLLTTLGDTVSIAIEESILNNIAQVKKNQQLEKRLVEIENKLENLQMENK